MTVAFPAADVYRTDLRRLPRAELVAYAEALEFYVDDVVAAPIRGDGALTLGLKAKLTPDQRALLGALLRFRGRTLSRQNLISAVMLTRPLSEEPAERTIDVHIVRIRRALAGTGIVIGTVVGLGYRIDRPERRLCDRQRRLGRL